MADETDTSHVFRLPERTGKGMSYERFEEIRKADKDGTPLEVTEEERAEYEEARASCWRRWNGSGTLFPAPTNQ